MQRRRFLHAATAGALAAGLSSRDARAEDDPLPIIDTHQHLWDLEKYRLPWIEKGSVLDRSYLMRDYLEATKGLNVVKSVYMEVDVEPSQQLMEAEDVAAVCAARRTPMAAAVVSGRPASEGFPAYVQKLREHPKAIRGIRQVLHGPGTPPGFCLEPAFVKGIRHLGANDLSFDICIRPAEMGDAAKLIDACPDTFFILDHCGNADVRAKDRSQWKADLARVAERKHVVCKVSGIVASAKGGPWTADDLAPIVNHVLDSFGPDRVMFGGDWPVCTLAATYRQWVEALKSIVRERPPADQRKLFHDNAARVYRLA